MEGSTVYDNELIRLDKQACEHHLTDEKDNGQYESCAGGRVLHQSGQYGQSCIHLTGPFPFLSGD